MKKLIVKILSILGGAIVMWLFLSLIVTFLASSQAPLILIITVNAILIMAGGALTLCMAFKFAEYLSELFGFEK